VAKNFKPKRERFVIRLTPVVIKALEELARKRQTSPNEVAATFISERVRVELTYGPQEAPRASTA
jgi:hypothetical protein